MFVARVSQIVHIEPAVPIADHRLMVIGPGLFAAHRLDGMHADNGFQPTIMSFWTGDGLSAVMYYIAIVSDESLNQLLIGHKDGSMLMTNGENDRSCLILEGLEVLRTMGTVDLMSVGVVVDVIPVAHLCRTRALGELFCKRLRGRTPGTVG